MLHAAVRHGSPLLYAAALLQRVRMGIVIVAKVTAVLHSHAKPCCLLHRRQGIVALIKDGGFGFLEWSNKSEKLYFALADVEDTAGAKKDVVEDVRLSKGRESVRPGARL